MPNVTKSEVETLQQTVEGVSILIPCKNEEESVGQTVRNIDEAFNGQPYDYEILVIDDGSTDSTRKEALKAGAKVLSHGINLGYGNAIMNGMTIARFSVVAIIDADGTYPAEMLPEMVELSARYDMVVGSRQWTCTNTSRLGRLFRSLLYYFILYFGNVRAPDFNSGFRVFHMGNILDFRQIICPTFSFTTSMTMLYLMTSRTIKFVPILYRERIGTSKVCYVRDALKTMSYIFLIANIFQPYRLSLFFLVANILANTSILASAAATGMSAGIQTGLHLMVTGSTLIIMVALCINPITRGYLNRVGGGR